MVQPLQPTTPSTFSRLLGKMRTGPSTPNHSNLVSLGPSYSTPGAQDAMSFSPGMPEEIDVPMPAFESFDWVVETAAPFVVPVVHGRTTDSLVPADRPITIPGLAKVGSARVRPAESSGTPPSPPPPSSSLASIPARPVPNAGSGSASGSSYYSSNSQGGSAGGSSSGFDSSGDRIRRKQVGGTLLSRSMSALGGRNGVSREDGRERAELGRSVGSLRGGRDEEGEYPLTEPEADDSPSGLSSQEPNSSLKSSTTTTNGYSSLSRRVVPLSGRPGLSSSQPALSAMSSSEVTPALARTGLGNTASQRMRRRIPAVIVGKDGEKPRRAKRVLIADLPKEEDGGEGQSQGGESFVSGASAEKLTPASDSSFSSNRRSQSDLDLVSPAFDAPLHDARSSVPSSAESGISSSDYLRRYDERSQAPSRPSSAIGEYGSRSRDSISSSSSSTFKPSPPSTSSLNPVPLRALQLALKPQSSAVLRERMLSRSTSVESAPIPTVSPPGIGTYEQLSSSLNSVSSRAAAMDMRRSQVTEETTARLEERRSPRTQPMLTPNMASSHRIMEETLESTIVSSDENGFARAGGSQMRRPESRDEETMRGRGEQGDGRRPLASEERTMSSRRGRTSFDYATEGPTEYQQPPPRPQSQQSYHPQPVVQDENDYNPRSNSQQQHNSVPFPRRPLASSTSSSAPPYQPPQFTQAPTHPPNRTILGETYRATNAPPIQQYQKPTRGSERRDDGEYVVPLRDGSPGMAEATPSMTHGGHHYVGSAAQSFQGQGQQQQQYQQQQQQQHQQQQQQQYHHQPLQQQQQMMQEVVVPVKQPSKPNRLVIVVNGKTYNRAGILGKGGSSKVYRVLDEKNNLFAIKRVDISKNDLESRNSFINEIHLLEKLRGHVEIIRLVDSEINESKKVLLMVMEVGETDLNNLLIEQSGKKISMSFIRHIWEHMLEAVQVIHNENVVHTDLKPANFVMVKGRLKLIDFGISKAIANDTTNIGRDQQIGTANYMPPEALIDSGMGQGGKRLMKLGRAADVWSLGCILHQMVYGRTPFSHLRDVGQKIMAIQNPRYIISYAPTTVPMNERGEELTNLAFSVPEELIETMRRCLVFDPKKRATIPELLEGDLLEWKREKVVVKSGTPTVDDRMASLIVQRIARVTRCSLASDDAIASLSLKLLMKIRDPKERVPISEGQMADWVEEVVSEWGGDHLSTEGRNKLASKLMMELRQT